MSYEEEDTCVSARMPPSSCMLGPFGHVSYEEEDTCVSYEEEDTCVS